MSASSGRRIIPAASWLLQFPVQEHQETIPLDQPETCCRILARYRELHHCCSSVHGRNRRPDYPTQSVFLLGVNSTAPSTTTFVFASLPVSAFDCTLLLHLHQAFSMNACFSVSISSSGTLFDTNRKAFVITYCFQLFVFRPILLPCLVIKGFCQNRRQLFQLHDHPLAQQ